VPTTSARRTAEALFTPKRQITEQAVPESVPPADHSMREPRALPSTAPTRQQGQEEPVSSEQQTTLEIPQSQFARIRAWRKYGMTAAQVAEVYGVAIGQVESLLQRRTIK
jgi:hypothetical protein